MSECRHAPVGDISPAPLPQRSKDLVSQFSCQKWVGQTERTRSEFPCQKSAGGRAQGVLSPCPSREQSSTYQLSALSSADNEHHLPHVPSITQEPPIFDSTPELLAHLAGTWHGAPPICPSLNHSDSPSGTNSCCTDGETEAPRGTASWSCGHPALLGNPFLPAGALQVVRWLSEF